MHFLLDTILNAVNQRSEIFILPAQFGCEKEMNRKILITGGTGLIGSKLVRELCGKGAFVRILSRNAKEAKAKFDKHFSLEAYSYEDYGYPGKLCELISETDTVINLAGENLAGKRWNSKFKEQVRSSRIETTRLLSEAIRLAQSKPECLISASGMIYGDSQDEIITEESSTGNDFLSTLCKDWEKEAMKSLGYGVRVVTIRTGIVLDSKEGPLPEMLKPFRYFAGAYFGSGKQYVSWIHIADIVNMYMFAIENTTISGPVNGTSPEPVTNKEFIKTAGKILKKKIIVSAPGFALKAAAGEFAEYLLTGQRVIPEKALNAGFEFKFPTLNSALKNLLIK